MVSPESWRDVLQAALPAIARAEEKGEFLTSEDLRGIFAWSDETDRLGPLDDLFSSGYITGRAYVGDHPHFHEIRGLRVAPRGEKEMERLGPR